MPGRGASPSPSPHLFFPKLRAFTERTGIYVLSRPLFLLLALPADPACGGPDRTLSGKLVGDLCDGKQYRHEKPLDGMGPLREGLPDGQLGRPLSQYPPRKKDPFSSLAHPAGCDSGSADCPVHHGLWGGVIPVFLCSHLHHPVDGAFDLFDCSHRAAVSGLLPGGVL